MSKYITPGIHENLMFSNETKINDKGSLVLGFQSEPATGMDAWETEDTGETMNGKFIIFPPNLKGRNFETGKEFPKTSAEIGVDLRVMRNLLVAYASLIGPKSDAIEAFGKSEMLKGLGVADDALENLAANLNQQPVLDKVYANLCKKFMEYMETQPGFKTEKFRHKFWRKNAKEAFAVIPSGYKPYPFESMQVPKEASKIGWTEWETKNKKNDASPSVKDNKVKSEQAESLFETGDEAETPQADAVTGDSLI